MIRGRCPICSKPFEIGSLDDLPSFPFCSDRCKLVDLGRWIDGAYAISGHPAREEHLDDDVPPDLIISDSESQ